MHNRGFTLIELMIVMVIMSILAVIVSGTFASSLRRGRDARRKDDLRNIANALESYYSDYGQYPGSDANGEILCTNDGTGACPWGYQFKDSKGTLYMVIMPQDPIDTQQYFYIATPNPVTGVANERYQLYAHLENANDAGDGVNQDGYANPTNTKCGRYQIIPCTYIRSSTDINLVPTPSM